MDTRERAQKLRRRLNEHALDVEPLAAEAADLFAEAGRDVHRRWLALELQGYGSAVDRAPLAAAYALHPPARPDEYALLPTHVVLDAEGTKLVDGREGVEWVAEKFGL